MSARAISLLLLLALAGCSADHQDLQEFVANSDKGLSRRIPALPEMKPYAPFAYEGFDLPDPFKPRKLQIARSDGGGMQPDLSRRKEPLEAFPLETLKMVGTLEQNKERYALVKAEGALYRVKTGNYLGQNFGQITQVGDTEVKIKEIIQDTAGDWSERMSSLQLLEEPAAGGKK